VSLRWYFDQHVPGPIVRGLRRRSVDCLTADDDGRRDLEDELILARATELGRILFTMDTDFQAISEAWQSLGRPYAGIVFAHQMKITYGDAIRDVESLAQLFEPADVANQFIRLPI
jgi:predicted nuclease of predicted toxin-antitoxin system